MGAGVPEVQGHRWLMYRVQGQAGIYKTPSQKEVGPERGRDHFCKRECVDMKEQKKKRNLRVWRSSSLVERLHPTLHEFSPRRKAQKGRFEN